MTDIPGPHHLPASQQQHRLVVVGRRLGAETDECTVVLIWDPEHQWWVFYPHGNPQVAACFTDSTVRAAAEHVLGRSA